MTMARSESCTAKAWTILLLVFLGGVASGVLAQKALDPKPPVPPTVAGQATVDPAEAVEHLERELALTPQQTQEVRGILDDCIMREADLMTQIQSIKSEGRERIRIVLNDSQRSKFQSLLLEASNH